MKNQKWTRILALLLTVVMVLAVFGCKTTETPATTEEPAATEPEATEEPAAAVADVPADRYDATATPRTGNNATMPLVISTSTLDGKFSPFFATSAYDVAISDMTQLGLLYYDKTGAPQAGIEYPSYAYSYEQEVADDKSTSTYTFVLKNGLVFSDGEPITIQDLLFSIYTLCDPLYDGSSTYYSMNIQGMSEYRTQTTAEVNEKYTAMAEAIFAAGVNEDGTYPEVAGYTAEQVAAYWSYLEPAGEKFAQEIVDYCCNKYTSYITSETPFETLDTDSKKVMFGMALWGFGSFGEDGMFTDALGNVYDPATAEVTVKTYWENILGSYGYNFSEDDGIGRESAGSLVQDLMLSMYVLNEGGKEIEGGIPSISGITSGKVTCDDGVERDYLQVVINGVDPTAIFKLGVQVCPMHYYTEGFAGELNEFGVSLNDKDFIALLKTKNTMPVGAGAYKFVEYKDNVVTYEANDSFLLGSPKIKTIRYQEITSGSELDAIKTGTVHYTDPSASTTIINDVTAGEGDYAKLGYILVDNDGYGYIGINAQFFPELEVREAIASTLNIDLCISDYYGELASVNYRTMTKVCWAYPENPTNLHPYDETGETAKALFLQAGFVYDEATNVMSYPEGYAYNGHVGGEQVTIKATLPMDAADHPSGSVFINAQEVLAKIGVKMDIEVDTSVLNKLSTAYESNIQMWAAAWGNGGVDPDMFQVWYSDPAQNQGTSPTAKGLFWLFENGSDEQKAMLTELNELIIAGRSTLDIEERKAIYEKALELSTSTCTEVPTYQRKNMYVYDKTVINADSMFSGDDVTPFQSPISFIWNVELLG